MSSKLLLQLGFVHRPTVTLTAGLQDSVSLGATLLTWFFVSLLLQGARPTNDHIFTADLNVGPVGRSGH